MMDACIAKFDPGAIVLQCGADSLAGDRLGKFNLTSAGHAAAVARVAGYGRPTLVLGGGGYKVANVARCWAAETGRLLGTELDDEVPAHEYSEFYASGGNRLRVPVRKTFSSSFLFSPLPCTSSFSFFLSLTRTSVSFSFSSPLHSSHSPPKNRNNNTPPPTTNQPRADLDNANSREYLDNLRTSLLRHVAELMPAGGAPNSGQTLGGERPPDAPVAAEAMETGEGEGGGEDGERPSSSRKQPLWDGTRDEAEDAADGR